MPKKTCTCTLYILPSLSLHTFKGSTFSKAVYTEAPPTCVRATSGQRSCNQTYGNDNQDFITVYYCLYFSYVCPVALSNDRNHEKNDEIAHCHLQSWVTVRFRHAGTIMSGVEFSSLGRLMPGRLIPSLSQSRKYTFKTTLYHNILGYCFLYVVLKRH